MSRTSKTLRRLGVPSLAAATMIAGIPAFMGTANAAHIASLALTGGGTATAGSCLPFTATLTFSANQTPRSETIDVSIDELDSDAATAGNQTSNLQDVDFCTLPTVASNGTTTTTTQPATPLAGSNDTGAAGTGDRAEFTATVASGATTATVTFGVTANQAGTANVVAFYEVDGSAEENNQLDASEFSDSSVATFTAGGANAAADVEVVSATDPFGPATGADNADTDTAVEGESRTYTVRVADAAGRALAGVPVSFTTEQNTGTEGDRGPAVFGTTNNSGLVTGTITFPTRAAATSADAVVFFVNQTDNPSGTQPGLAPNGEEPSDTLTVTVVDNANQQNRTVTVAALPDEEQAGNEFYANNPAVNPARDGDRTFRATVNAADTAGETEGTLLTFAVTGGSGDETVVPRETATAEATAVTTGTTQTADPNDSAVDVVVNDPTPIPGQTLTVTATIRGTSAAGSSTLTFRNVPTDARNIDLQPNAATSTTNTATSLTATVVDSAGRPVAGVVVRFTETGAGAFRNGASTVDVTTDANGRALIETISLPGETGTQTVTATIATPGTQATQAAGQGQTSTGGNVPSTQTAGNASDSSTVTFVTAPPTTPPTTPPPGGGVSPDTNTVALRLQVAKDTIVPTEQGVITIRGAANAVVDVFAYSRPSIQYRLVRPGVQLGADGTAVIRILPGTNTRLFARYRGAPASATTDSPSVVQAVATSLSLTVVRNGPRNYTFQGRILPRRAGQLITLYRVTGDGREILTAQVRTDATGTWRINRRFTGSGTFGFLARTGQNLTNVAGVSNNGVARRTAIF